MKFVLSLFRRCAALQYLCAHAGLLSAFLLCSTVTSCSNSDAQNTPAKMLQNAQREFDAGQLDRALDMSAAAAEDPALKGWALLLRGRVLEKMKKYDEAGKVFRQVPSDSAASLDSRVELVRLALQDAPSKDSAALGDEISALESEISRAERSDLVDTLSMVRAEAAESHGDRELALNIYQSVRRRHPGQGVGLIARAAVWRLQEALGGRVAEPSIPGLMTEARQLLKEHEPALAMERIQRAKNLVTRRTPSYFEVMLSAEQALRQQGKTQEADAVLAEVGADGDRATARKALMRIIKNAWNKNDDSRTLRFIEELRNRFGQSVNTDEVQYIEARTLDHSGDSKAAEARYSAVADKGDSVEFRLKALRQLAWRAFRQNNFTAAAGYFKRGYDESRTAFDKNAAEIRQSYGDAGGWSAVREETSRRRIRTARDLLDDLLHNYFWFALSMSKIPDEKSLKAFPDAESAEDIWRHLVQEAPDTYYAGLAAEKLHAVAPAHSTDIVPACLTLPPARRLKDLQHMSSAGLVDIADAEIRWHMAQSLNAAERLELTQALAGAKPFSQEQTRLLLTKAKLLSEYGHPNNGVLLADMMLKRPKDLQPFSFDLSPCRSTLRRLAYPVPDEAAFRHFAEENKIPASLMLAIARTESFFDPLARSIKDARGLMQLLPKTATLEGMAADGDLFDPETNIRYAAKHLARLLHRFDNSPAVTAAAYNAGPDAAQRWIDAVPTSDIDIWVENISYPETRDYAKKVLLAKQIYGEILTDDSLPK
jgi:soluble lytic murein transglycosylase-like protein/tetratricopeptide (TPR) repeat protein